MAITSDAVICGRQEHRAKEISSSAGSCQVRGGLMLAHPGLQRRRSLQHRSRSAGPDLPVVIQDDWIKDVAQRCNLTRHV